MFEGLTQKFSGLLRAFSGKGTITEKNIQEALEEVKQALLEADVNLRVVRRFLNRAQEEALGAEVLKSVKPGEQFIKYLYDSLVRLLGEGTSEIELRGPDVVSPILLLGLQGSGKTTTSAKLALRLKTQGRRVLLVAADLVRPAAVEQLQTLGRQIGVEVFAQAGKPEDVVKAALKHAERFQFNTVLIDTAGRLQVDEPLMAELKRIHDLAKPVEKLLVADAMTGQSAVDVALAFDQAVGVTGFILSKFDSDTRGGAALSLKSITGKPVKFIGLGEKVENLEVFHPERIASRILGMGDVVSLVEKAQAAYAPEEAQDLRRKLAGNAFTLADYLDQMQKMKSMGSMQSLMELMPGLGQMPAGELDEKALKREEAILLSMTKAERRNHLILGPNRRKRIARGSGTSVHEVNALVKKFEKTRDMMRKVSKNKTMQKQMLASLGAGPRA